jgi:hypothetical protein
MITNAIKKIDNGTIEIPVIVRADQEGWIPTFEIWSTKVDENTSYIDCTQSFRPKSKKYHTSEIDPRIGYYENNNLFIHWKSLVNNSDLDLINATYNGKLRICYWQNRYCVYFGTGSNLPWLHSTILEDSQPGDVKHHINGVPEDNRLQNLHRLPKREHDSINHPDLNERKLMFANPQEYWKMRKSVDIDKFITQLALIITFEGQAEFIAKFAKENIQLAREILQAARICINLNSVKPEKSKNRILNPHLSDDYLDAYEIEKYLRKYTPKSNVTEGQLKLF